MTSYSFGAVPGWMNVVPEGEPIEREEVDIPPPEMRRQDSGYASPSTDEIERARQAREAQDKRRPLDDLKSAVRTLKARYPNVKSVGVWLTLQGCAALTRSSADIAGSGTVSIRLRRTGSHTVRFSASVCSSLPASRTAHRIPRPRTAKRAHTGTCPRSTSSTVSGMTTLPRSRKLASTGSRSTIRDRKSVV